uniref:Uncharacterized protein n=1 Tax=Mimivirus LCMiAC02 TaxID=2506609 RepID=A0A481Z0Y1_9VIRU|nr:MAG: hypothetical protein LCMiAC02_02210 [Mimivirus LCMiAC02]
MGKDKTKKSKKGRSKGTDDGDKRNALTKLADCFWNVNNVERSMKSHCEDHELTVFKEITVVKLDDDGGEVLDKNDKKVRTKTGKFTKEVPMFSNTAQSALTAMLERLTEYITTTFAENNPESDDDGLMVMDANKLMNMISSDEGLCDFYNIKRYDSHADYSIPISKNDIKAYISTLNSNIKVKRSALLFLKWLIGHAYQKTMELSHTIINCGFKKTLSARPLVKAVEFLFNDHLGHILAEQMKQTATAVGKYVDDPPVQKSTKSKKKKRKTKTKTKTKTTKKSRTKSSRDDSEDDSGNDSGDDSGNDSGDDSGNDSGDDSGNDSDDDGKSRKRKNKKSNRGD